MPRYSLFPIQQTRCCILLLIFCEFGPLMLPQVRSDASERCPIKGRPVNTDWRFCYWCANPIMPHVIGKSRDEAVSLLSECRRTPDAFKEIETDKDTGLVIDSSPKPGKHILPKDKIALVVSIKVIHVPDLTSLTVQQAEAQDDVKRWHLSIMSMKDQYNDTFGEGQIIAASVLQDGQRRQDGKVRVNGTIRVWVCKGKPQIPTDLIGMEKGKAINFLLERTLVGKEAEPDYSYIPAGRIIKSDPEPGKVVSCMSEVKLTVSKGQESLRYDNKLASDAKAELEKRGFEVTTEPRTNTAVAAGHVIKSFPEVVLSPPNPNDPNSKKVTLVVNPGPGGTVNPINSTGSSDGKSIAFVNRVTTKGDISKSQKASIEKCLNDMLTARAKSAGYKVVDHGEIEKDIRELGFSFDLGTTERFGDLGKKVKATLVCVNDLMVRKDVAHPRPWSRRVRFDAHLERVVFDVASRKISHDDKREEEDDYQDAITDCVNALYAWLSPLNQ